MSHKSDHHTLCLYYHLPILKGSKNQIFASWRRKNGRKGLIYFKCWYYPYGWSITVSIRSICDFRPIHYAYPATLFLFFSIQLFSIWNSREKYSYKWNVRVKSYFKYTFESKTYKIEMISKLKRTHLYRARAENLVNAFHQKICNENEINLYAL